jgi:hypothetical protein
MTVWVGALTSALTYVGLVLKTMLGQSIFVKAGQCATSKNVGDCPFFCERTMKNLFSLLQPNF